jgi:hypothetical protein
MLPIPRILETSEPTESGYAPARKTHIRPTFMGLLAMGSI